MSPVGNGVRARGQPSRPPTAQPAPLPDRNAPTAAAGADAAQPAGGSEQVQGEFNGEGAALRRPQLRDLSAAELEALVHDSPFLDVDHPIGMYEALKLALMAPLVVLKWAVLLVAVVYSWLVLAVLLAGHRNNEPMSPFRRTLVGSWVRFWSGLVLFVCGFYRVPVLGWANMRAAQACRAVVVFNHESYVDPLVLAALLAPSGVAKASVAQLPFISLFAHGLQFLFIQRRGTRDKDNRHTMRGDPIQAIAQRAADPRFPLVMIAPEATTKARRCLLRFRRGAFSVGRPVVPVLLRYHYERFNPGWGVVYTPLHVWRLLSQLVNHVSVEVLPPYCPTAEERADPMKFAANVRGVMARRLGVPLVEQGVDQERELILRGIAPDLLGRRVVVPQLASRPLRHEDPSAG